MEKFRTFELSNSITAKITGGNNPSEDGPITDLGTVSNDGSA